MPLSDETHVWHRDAWTDAGTSWAPPDTVQLDPDHELLLHYLQEAFGPVAILTGRDYMPRSCSECLSDILSKPVIRKTGTYCGMRCAAIAKGRVRLRSVPGQKTLREVIRENGPHYHNPLA